jgi:phage-related tail protein
MTDGDAGTAPGTAGSDGDGDGAGGGDGNGNGSGSDDGGDRRVAVRAGAGLAVLGLSLVADGVADGRVATRIGRARTVAVGGAILAVGVTVALAVTRGPGEDGNGGDGKVVPVATDG